MSFKLLASPFLIWAFTNAAQAQVSVKQFTNQEMPEGTAWGEVLEENTQRPVYRAQIQLYRKQKLVASGKTNLHGEYWFKPQKRGNYSLVVTAPEYKARTVELTISGKSQRRMPTVYLPHAPPEKKGVKIVPAKGSKVD